LVAAGNPDELRARTGGARVEIVGRGFNAGALAQLRARPEVAAVTVCNGRLSIDLRAELDVPSLVSLLASNGAQVDEVRRGKASLEEVFVTLMEEEK